MNINKWLIDAVEQYRAENKQPCKNYATEEACEKATSEMAMKAATYFTKPNASVRSARYIVVYNPHWQRWVGAIDLSELLTRSTSNGGYLGFCKGFYTF